MTYDRYISALEERVAFLEARLPDHADDHLGGTSEVSQQPSPVTACTPCPGLENRRGSCLEPQIEMSPKGVELNDGTSLIDGVAYLSLCASGTTTAGHGPLYVGSSSGSTIAHIIQSSIYHNSKIRSDHWTPTDHDLASTTTDESSQADTPNLSEPASALPSPSQARMLFAFFFERIHPRWPLLDRALYENLFEQQYEHSTLSVSQRSILHLIYAITARFLAVTKKPCGVDDEVSLIVNLYWTGTKPCIGAARGCNASNGIYLEAA